MEVDDEGFQGRFFRACEAGQHHAALAELQAGASLQAVDSLGRTALLTACWGGNAELVDALLQAGADVSALDREGFGAGLLAAESGNVELYSLLISSGRASLMDCAEDGATALLCAAAGGSSEMVNWLLDGAQGEDIVPSLEERDDRGANALLVAAENGHRSVLATLKGRGASLDIVDDQGDTALHYAASNGDVNTLKFCVQSLGIKCDARDNDGDTPLIVAAQEGHVSVVQWLLKHGSSLTERNNDGMSSYMAALAGEQTHMIEVLNHLGGEEVWMSEIESHPELLYNFIERGGLTGGGGMDTS